MFVLFYINSGYQNISDSVQRCGPGGSMCTCHAAGPGSIPSRDKFPGWGFFRGFSSPVRQMSGSFRPPRSPNIIWPSLSSSIIIHSRHQWPEMLTCPKTSKIHTFQTVIMWTLILVLHWKQMITFKIVYVLNMCS